MENYLKNRFHHVQQLSNYEMVDAYSAGFRIDCDDKRTVRLVQIASKLCVYEKLYRNY